MIAQSMIVPTNESFAHLWNTMDSVEQGQSAELSILYIGGSHVQAGWLGHGLRQAIADWIPHAQTARGLMLPYRMANTNTPTHFRTEFSGNWEGIRCTEIAYLAEHPNSSCGTGIVVQPQGSAWFQHVSYAPDSSHHLASQLTIWTNASLDEWNWEGNVPLTYCEPLPEKRGWRLHFAAPADTLAVSFTSSASEMRLSEPLWYGGAASALKSSNANFVVHDWGHNGLRIHHAAEERGWSALVDDLKPDLVLIGIGLNDAMRGSNFDAAEFQDSYLSLLEPLGDLAIVLLGNTPIRVEPERALGNSRTIDAILRDLADREGFGFFSFTESLGGSTAWEACQSNGWLKSDGIHFTESGYLALSSILFKAWQTEFQAHRP